MVKEAILPEGQPITLSSPPRCQAALKTPYCLRQAIMSGIGDQMNVVRHDAVGVYTPETIILQGDHSFYQGPNLVLSSEHVSTRVNADDHLKDVTRVRVVDSGAALIAATSNRVLYHSLSLYADHRAASSLRAWPA